MFCFDYAVLCIRDIVQDFEWVEMLGLMFWVWQKDWTYIYKTSPISFYLKKYTESRINGEKALKNFETKSLIV